MNASAKPAGPIPKAKTMEPAKGGTKPATNETYPSGDSPKPHGDKLERASRAATQKKAG